MKDKTKNTVPKGSNNERKRETVNDDAENSVSQSRTDQIYNSVPLKRAFGSVISDVTNKHPSVGIPIILSGQLSSLRASVVFGTNNGMHLYNLLAFHL